MWESRSDFHGGCETRRVLQLPSLPQPFCGLSQPLEEFGFGLLHALGSFAIADGSSDAVGDGGGGARGESHWVSTSGCGTTCCRWWLSRQLDSFALSPWHRCAIQPIS